MASVQLAGKTAPRLVQDIELYDPAHDPDTGRNLLSETPLLYPLGYDGPRSWISPTACRHEYVLKTDQTFLAQAEHRRRPGTSSKVAAICSKCRCHLKLVVNHSNNVQMQSQALKGEHIHHLVYKSGRQKNGVSMPEMTHRGQIAETYHYQCSYTSCAAMVSLRILSPVLSEEFVHLMTDEDLLQKRAEEAFATYSETMEGMAKPEPINLLDNLRLYITNSLRNPQRSKPIASGNKRFVHVFGVEGAACKDLLEFLEFSYVEDTGVWHPPKPIPGAEKPYQDPLCVFLDDVILELLALMHQRPASEKRGHQFPHLSPSAIPDILYALEASDYPKAPGKDEFEMPSDSCYEDLGVTEDMSSVAITEAYRQQIVMDPKMAPYYLSCLKLIGGCRRRRGKDDEYLTNAINEAYLEGQFASEDVEQAYQFFGFDIDDRQLNNNRILECFYEYVGSPTQENKARQELSRIGKHRESDRLMAASEDRVVTVEQANIYLGVENETPDDFVMTMYTAKVNDHPSTRALAGRALELIAESRKSPSLTHFLHTGETLAAEMDIGDAYRLLQIPDQTTDDGAIMAAYTICIDDNPSDADRYNQALVIIANHIDSAPLKASAGISTEPQRNMQDWPVGLQNIGNTCYLNSLLQFYFSVRPFREMVLDLERFQMDLGDMESLAKKQVGSRKVTKKEVERSMRFLNELRTLYIGMITSSQNSVTPGQELARLTLISPGNEAAVRRRSTITASRAQILGDINGAPVLGPLGHPPIPPGSNLEQDGSAPIQAPTAGVSLGDTIKTPDNTTNGVPGLFADGTENATPELDDLASDQAEIGSVRSDADMEIEPNAPASTNPDNSNLPPPVPPRPIPEIDREKQLKEELEYGAQQDVTEVINNVLFQSQCAIKARGIDDDGEQIDQIKDLFYGTTRSYISTEKGTRSKNERWCDIKVDVAHGSRDIYSAIDAAFDVQKISVDNTVAEQFGSISHIPPVLQIQVQRVQFDPVKKSSFKSTNHLELLDTIYMDRYMDTKNPEIVERREQCWKWKALINRLEDRREQLLRKKENDGMDKAALLRQSQLALVGLDSLEQLESLESDTSALGIDSQLIKDVKNHAGGAEAELEAVEQEIKDTQAMISSQFADYHNLPYRLYAVFVHHGSVSFGHYYIYIYDFEKNIWRKYNDEYVTEVTNLDEIFKGDSTSNPPTPYFLVYVNSDMKERLVNPVCREVDVVMPERATSTLGEDKAASPSGDVSGSTPQSTSGMDPPSSPVTLI
ncbi:unnamed protein product [Penicillium salamii]|nr:unnamed protein product [Penicillium salamii]CAG8371281.1 unnamed protein product [Penicillium salamii]